MTKISKRLKAIAEFVSNKDSVVDVGCDHGLLSIYLVENKLAKKVIASDINQNALNSAIKNITSRKLEIETILSDGINDVNLTGINTLVISGMGTSTILHILESEKKIKKINKLIIQSNNDHELLRRSLNDKGYFLEDEVYTLDKGKWYVTCKFIKSDEVNDGSVLKYGMLDNLEYNKYILTYEKSIFKKIPFTSVTAKIKALKKLRDLEKAISKRK